MSELHGYEELVAAQRKEKKDLTAKTQKMKHGIPKGDKKKKKEVTAEITQLLADLELKHENEMKEFESNTSGALNTIEVLEASKSNNPHDPPLNSENILPQDNEANLTDENIEGTSKVAQKISKAQKRRNKKALALKERNKAIADQELENLTSTRHVESEEINKKLSKRNLTVHEIAPDGNCLYKAIEHQLLLKSELVEAQSLRELTADFMIKNMDDYLPFLTSPETGDVLTEEQYKKYCEDIANTSVWGGHIEIQALSHVCKMPIEVIQAEGPSVIAGNENSDPKLTICYYRHVYGLGEHYNSVVPIAHD